MRLPNELTNVATIGAFAFKTTNHRFDCHRRTVQYIYNNAKLMISLFLTRVIDQVLTIKSAFANEALKVKDKGK